MLERVLLRASLRASLRALAQALLQESLQELAQALLRELERLENLAAQDGRRLQRLRGERMFQQQLAHDDTLATSGNTIMSPPRNCC